MVFVSVRVDSAFPEIENVQPSVKGCFLHSAAEGTLVKWLGLRNSVVKADERMGVVK